MKTLIVYYSLTGNNREAAEILAEELSADLDEIVDQKRRSGKKLDPLVMAKAAFSALMKRKTRIKTMGRKPIEYDQIVLMTPIWAQHIPPATRTYIVQNKEKIRKPSLLSISGSGEKNKAFTDRIEELLGKKLENVMLLSEKEDNKAKIRNFAAKLK